MNDSKPYGNVLDFRQQQKPVEEAITLFSGKKTNNPREIWLVDPAPKVIDTLQAATQKLADFMQSQGLTNAPEDVANLKGDAVRSQFVNLFKEVQRLKTQLDQYTDLSEEQKTQITQIVPPDQMLGFKGMYTETAKRLKAQQDRDQTPPEVQQLDFEFVLFASAVIDYDYIMGLIARMTQQKPGKLTLNREQLIGLIQADAKFIDDRDDIAEYIRGLPVGGPWTKTPFAKVLIALRRRRKIGCCPRWRNAMAWEPTPCKPSSMACCAATFLMLKR
ncbi:type I restriction endonuclease subunit R, EcoR124 family [Paludibacterium denitrificans]|uniref:type I restriction endonuclease subunit R, EcoR124 family n=1 Tax=Paludibacterium denitrificans TaxID=2675226 RepID=UPI002477EA0C|nr:hypothetical protein [Paludibacterium denitrificans]